ncbi:MAG: protein kinase [Chloroflexi bacterium]|nr:protein kinase [Chloroflexota bacterium]
MVSERIQRRIDALLDEAEEAFAQRDWARLRDLADDVLKLDPENADALVFGDAAIKGLDVPTAGATGAGTVPQPAQPPLPTSFAGGRYAVRRFLGEGGRKRVFLAHDNRLDRDVAFCLIRAEGLDATGHQRVLREAQSVARLGQHPNLVTVHDIGEDDGNPYIVQEYMAGGDVAGLISAADDRRLPVERILAVAKDVCRGLSFIHAGGMVHRDLKPANIFLSTGGAARIGDFGLAVALDRSRITQYGLMLGTVSYMPPEQALGGESTPQADLYSLGAMLYEMVTGRPPFIGDDPTAVISQHINTPPVAPSWLTDHCPPQLEDVILQLLAKAPVDRLKSADAVLAALEKVDPAQKSASHSDSNVLDRLARGVFVGRDRELEKLRKAFDEAFAGRGGLVMLVGEPGIGKTRAAQELETYAKMRGAQVLWGRAHEASGAPPYWPWVQAGRQWGANGDQPLLARAMAAGSWELVRLFPEARQQPGFVEPPATPDPAYAQFLLFDAYAAFISTISEAHPVVILLDDVHWTDKPTLLLLQHFARSLSGARVLVVCTYRDTDLSRTHPLSDALAGLNRDPGFERIVLRGLNKAEVRAYIASVANLEPSPALLDRIFEETEGNPFFLAEVVNLLTEEGTLGHHSVSDIRIPDGVKEALGRRLDRLSSEANALLQVAAVVGREFNYDTLRHLGDQGEDTLLRLVEEGLGARVIEEMERAGSYRFTHALMQETLLSELSTTRRVRLHGQVGEALERRWGDRAFDYASRLATHFVESSTLAPAHADKAFRYARVAAEQSEARYAWAEAARWHTAALTIASNSSFAGTAEEVDTYIALGRCEVSENRLRDGFRTYMRGITVARQSGLPVKAAQVALQAVGLYMLPERALRLIEQGLIDVGDNDPHLRCGLLAVGAGLPGGAGARMLEEAETLLQGNDWPEVAVTLAFVRGNDSAKRGKLDDAEAQYRRAHDVAVAHGGLHAAAGALRGISALRSFQGNLAGTLECARQSLAIAERGRLRPPALQSHTVQAAVYYAWGEHEESERHIEAASGVEWDRLVTAARARAEHRPADALATVPAPDPSIIPVYWGHYWAERACALALLGETAQANLEFDNAWTLLPPAGDRLAAEVSAIPALVEAAILLHRRTEARELYHLHATWPLFSHVPVFSFDRVRGDLALFLGETAKAAAWFTAGAQVCERERCHLDAARCYLGLAEVAALNGDGSRALEYLGKAAPVFQEYGAALFLERAIARRLELQGVASGNAGASIDTVYRSVHAERPDLSLHASPDGTVTLMFTDIENSTALTEQHGDAKWLELLRYHNAVVEREVRGHGGRVVKNRGDGYMLTFANPARGLDCALAIQQALAGHEVIRVRIGIHTGNPAREGDDFFGTDVNLAARVADSARGGQVLVSERVHGLLAPTHPGRFGEPVEAGLKGLSGQHRLYPVPPRD